jgi:hypothetical protein
MIVDTWSPFDHNRKITQITTIDIFNTNAEAAILSLFDLINHKKLYDDDRKT